VSGEYVAGFGVARNEHAVVFGEEEDFCDGLVEDFEHH
jgi:hypothetical protein